MQWTIPGKALPAATEETASIQERFQAMFLGGGIAHLLLHRGR